MLRQRVRYSICLILILPALAGGCTPHYYADSYDLPLTAVRRPAEVSQRWGDYRLSESPDGITYSDELIWLMATPDSGVFVILFENLTEHSLRVIWDEATYVGPTGFASKIYSGKATLLDTRSIGTLQTPTVVPPRAKARLSAIPLENIHAAESGGPEVRDFFLQYDTDAVQDQDVQLILPIKVEDVINEYTLVFTVKSIIRSKCSDSRGRTGCEVVAGHSGPQGYAEGPSPTKPESGMVALAAAVATASSPNPDYIRGVWKPVTPDPIQARAGSSPDGPGQLLTGAVKGPEAKNVPRVRVNLDRIGAIGEAAGTAVYWHEQSACEHLLTLVEETEGSFVVDQESLTPGCEQLGRISFAETDRGLLGIWLTVGGTLWFSTQLEGD